MLYLFILQCNPDFSELVGTRKLVNILLGGLKNQVYTIPTFVTDNYQEVHKPMGLGNRPVVLFNRSRDQCFL